MASSDTLLMSSILEESRPSGESVTVIQLHNSRTETAIVDATLARYTDLHNRPSGSAAAAALGALDTGVYHPQVSVLLTGTNMLGGRIVVAREGRLFNDGTAILPKGATRNGRRINAEDVLDVEAGYGHTKKFAERLAQTRATLPQLTTLTQEHLTALPSRGNDIKLVVFGTWRMVGTKVPGAIWLLHSYLAEDDIAEGVLLLPPTGEGFSEHGSVYGRDLLAGAVGVVEGAPQMSFKQALDLTGCDDHNQMLVAIGAGTMATV